MAPPQRGDGPSAFEQQPVRAQPGRATVDDPVVEHLFELRVQRDVAFVVELADGDSQPERRADLEEGVDGEASGSLLRIPVRASSASMWRRSRSVHPATSGWEPVSQVPSSRSSDSRCSPSPGAESAIVRGPRGPAVITHAMAAVVSSVLTAWFSRNGRTVRCAPTPSCTAIALTTKVAGSDSAPALPPPPGKSTSSEALSERSRRALLRRRVSTSGGMSNHVGAE